MSEPRRIPVDPTPARNAAPEGPPAAVIAFRRRDPSVLEDRRPRDSQPETPAPRAARRFENSASLHAPARRATVAVAAVLAVLCAIAGVIVALSLGGVLTLDAPSAQARDVDIPAWHVGWGAVSRTTEASPQQPTSVVSTTRDVPARDVPRTPRKRKPIIKRDASDGFVRVFNEREHR